MNDEQFEESLQALEQAMWPSTAEKLRSRDTAQREALARMEAERDTAIAQMQNIRRGRDAINKELGDAGFNLCIAQQQLAEAVGLLNDPDRGYKHGWFPTQAKKIEDFLARHTQAEQQEAGHGHITPRADGVVMKCGGPGLCAVCTAEQEAKGAQVGEFQREDRYIVIKREDLVALHRDAFGPTQVAIEAFYAGLRSIELQLPRRDYLVIEGDWPEYEPTWAAIQARVEGRDALATQPAVQFNPEPVAHLKVEVLGRITKVDIEWPNGLHTTLPTGKYPLYIVRGAEHDQ